MINKKQWNNLSYKQRSAISNLFWVNDSESKRIITSKEFHHKFDYVMKSLVFNRTKQKMIEISENVGEWMEKMLSSCSLDNGNIEVVVHNKLWIVTEEGKIKIDNTIINKSIESIKAYVNKERELK